MDTELRKGLIALATLLWTVSCSMLPRFTPPLEEPPAEDSVAGQEVSRLMAYLRHDLDLNEQHLRGPSPLAPPEEPPAAEEAGTLRGMVIPVAGVTASELRDNYGDPRSGGRWHRGIDIFAPRGTPVLAAMDGLITYVGVQGRGGRCLWLTTNFGRAFYYAHLDRWAESIREGVRVRRGTVLGYVGTTGNARHTPPHLHFQVSEGGDDVDPLQLLRAASAMVLGGGFGRR